jgi:hypothetical protein
MVGSTAGGFGVMPVPQNTAFVVKNNTTERTVVIRGKEIVSSLGVSNVAAHSGSYPVQLFDLNPVGYEGTRMKQLARSFQKYRFRKAHLTVQANAPTTTTGGYVAGYTENPDQGFDDNAISQISTLSGAVSAPLWVAQTLPARIRDGKWYNVDPDTIEVMDSIQGMFVLQQTSAASTTAALNFPVWLDYEIEFSGCAAQSDPIDRPPTVYAFPPGFLNSFTSTLWPNHAINYNGNSSVIPSLPINASCSLEPGFDTKTGEEAAWCWCTQDTGAGGRYYLFASSEDNMVNGVFLTQGAILGNQSGASLDVPAMVGYPVATGVKPPTPTRATEPLTSREKYAARSATLQKAAGMASLFARSKQYEPISYPLV